MRAREEFANKPLAFVPCARARATANSEEPHKHSIRAHNIRRYEVGMDEQVTWSSEGSRRDEVWRTARMVVCGEGEEGNFVFFPADFRPRNGVIILRGKKTKQRQQQYACE